MDSQVKCFCEPDDSHSGLALLFEGTCHDVIESNGLAGDGPTVRNHRHHACRGGLHLGPNPQSQQAEPRRIVGDCQTVHPVQAFSKTITVAPGWPDRRGGSSLSSIPAIALCYPNHQEEPQWPDTWRQST